jgi:CRP-like cAMP-binding protein
MSIEDDIVFLERIPMLGQLGRDALRILAIGAENRHVRGGEVLFYAGDRADAGYVIQEGTIQVEPDHTITPAPAFTAGPGTLLGETALLVETTRPATATALEPSTVIRISRSLFLKMLEGFPEAAQRLRDDIAARLDESNRDLRRVRSKLDRVERTLSARKEQ